MATKNRKSFNGDWKGFIDAPLTEEHRRQVIDWDTDLTSWCEALEALCQEGFKVSVSWNEKTQSFIVALTGTAASGANAGYTMSSHARTVELAVRVAAFKHYVLLDRDWNKARLNKDGADFG